MVQGRATRIGRAGIDDAVVILRVSTPRGRHDGRRRGNGKIPPTTRLVSASSWSAADEAEYLSWAFSCDEGVAGCGLDCPAARLVLGGSFSGHL